MVQDQIYISYYKSQYHTPKQRRYSYSLRGDSYSSFRKEPFEYFAFGQRSFTVHVWVVGNDFVSFRILFSACTFLSKGRKDNLHMTFFFTSFNLKIYLTYVRCSGGEELA